MNKHRSALAFASLGLASLLGGCEIIETATSDRPDSTQQAAIAGVLGHFGQVASLVDDPAGASDADVAKLFATEHYFQLLDPQGSTAALVQGARRAAPLFDPSCVQADASGASWDCPVDFLGTPCQVSGSGASEGDGVYRAAAQLSGESGVCAAGVSLDAAFTLVTSGATPSGSGTLTVSQGGAGAFGFEAVLEGLTFCTDGVPNGGRIRVTGTGAAASLPQSPISIKFTGLACGVAIIE